MKDRKIKIVAIGDNGDNLTTLKALIKDVFPEIKVFTALTGQQGIELAAVQEPDVIILDNIMPLIDGFEVCRKLKADPILSDIPLVFLTESRGDKENRIRALECGAEALLTKPIDEIELTAQIRAMLKIRAANIEKRDEKETLSALVKEKTKELKDSNTKLSQSYEDIKSEQGLLEAIFDSIPGYLYVYDENGRLIKWNNKHETMTGFSAEELSHMTLEKWFDQEDIVKVKAAVRDVFKNGYGEVEAQLILKNGKRMMIRSTGVPLVLNGHKYFAGIGIDITERKKIELQLQQSMDDLLESQRIAHVGTWRLDLATNEVVWSEELYKMYGFDPTIPPPPYTEHMKLFTPDSWRRLSTSLDLTRTSGIPYELELETVTKEGSNGWMWVRGEANKDSNGKIVSLRGAAQDITERKKIEHETRQSEERFQLLFNKAPLGYQSLDLDGCFIDVNQKWLDTLGYSKEEVIGKWFGDFLCPEYVDGFRQRFPIFKAQGYIHSEFEMRRKDGRLLFLSFEGKVGYGADGEFKQTHCILQDITEQRKAENELVYISRHDHLTGLYNRRYFEESLATLDKEENLPISIIMGDLNGLKLINDSFGHETGDELLKKASEVIKNQCRPGDIAARLGGMNLQLYYQKQILQQRSRFLNSIKKTTSMNKVAGIDLSISFGVDTKETDRRKILETLANAENDMYRHKLYERSSMRSKTIDFIMNTLFEKSNREMLHSKRVSGISEAIATKMNYNKDEIGRIRIAGLVHDIGKIGIDEKTLNKVGKLDDAEWKEIKRHPEMGWRILSSTNEFSELASIVIAHHEKWDGSGYPNGLKGEEIPLEARIIAVSDAYDAMTSERSYRKPFSKEEAMKEVKRCSGKQFDPKIVDAFLNLVLQHNNDFRGGNKDDV